MERGTPTTPQRNKERGAVVSPDAAAEGNNVEDNSDENVAEVHDNRVGDLSSPDVDEDNLVVRSIPSRRDALEATAAANCMMLSMQQGGAAALPTLKTGPWPHKAGDVPNPVSTAKARKLLATGKAKTPCDIPGTGVHGCAFMADKPSAWNKRSGVSDHTTVTVAMPKKSELTAAEATDVTKVLMHNMKMQPCVLHNHVKESRKDKIIEWFGTDLFADMCAEGAMPPQTTPNDMLEHLEGTCAQPSHYCRLMEQVEKMHTAECNPKDTVEKCFMTLQEARENATLLEQPFTDEQTMNKATTQFIGAHGREAEKAERTWNKKTDGERTWTNFKKFWKEEIHLWSLSGANGGSGAKVDALEAEMRSAQGDASALQAKNRNHQQENHSLRTQQFQTQQALQAKQATQNGRARARDDQSQNGSRTGSNDISALTEAVSLLTKDVKFPRDKSEGTGTTAGTDTQPGRGGKHIHCWKCGSQLHHWTRQCRFPSKEDKQKCRNLTGTNTMGGNEKNCDRFGKHESDFE